MAKYYKLNLPGLENKTYSLKQVDDWKKKLVKKAKYDSDTALAHFGRYADDLKKAKKMANKYVKDTEKAANDLIKKLKTVTKKSKKKRSRPAVSNENSGMIPGTAAAISQLLNAPSYEDLGNPNMIAPVGGGLSPAAGYLQNPVPQWTLGSQGVPMQAVEPTPEEIAYALGGYLF